MSINFPQPIPDCVSQKKPWQQVSLATKTHYTIQYYYFEIQGVLYLYLQHTAVTLIGQLKWLKMHHTLMFFLLLLFRVRQHCEHDTTGRKHPTALS